MIVHSLSEYQKIFESIHKIKPRLILLKGDLGAGKTTFVREFLNSCFSENKVEEQGFMSPTFSILNQYDFDGRIYSHIDLYRLESGEIEDLDLESIFQNSEMVFIEWYEKAQEILGFLNLKKVYIEIKKRDMVREVNIS